MHLQLLHIHLQVSKAERSNFGLRARVSIRDVGEKSHSDLQAELRPLRHGSIDIRLTHCALTQQCDVLQSNGEHL